MIPIAPGIIRISRSNFLGVSVGKGIIGFAVLFLVTVAFANSCFWNYCNKCCFRYIGKKLCIRIRSFTSSHRNTI